MSSEICRIDSQIEKLKKRRSALVAAERKAKERALLAAAEKRGLLALPLDQIESIFSTLYIDGEPNVTDRNKNSPQ